MRAFTALGVKAKVWLVLDGAYAARPFLLPVLAMNVVVVSRLRKDASLHDLPPEGFHGNRINGLNKISLAKRAAHRHGWSTISYRCRGVEVTRQYWEAGQQQVHNVWSNIGCWNLNQWLNTLVELCSWDAAKSQLTDRGDRPWDNPDRRPSHADRRRTIARKMLRIPILAALPRPETNPNSKDSWNT